MFKFFSERTERKTTQFKDTVKEAKAADPEPDAKVAPSPPGSICIKVDGKVVYEGPSGSLKVEHPTSNYSSVSQVIINGVNIGGGSVSMSGVSVVIEGDVQGDVDAPMDVRCGNVKGNVDAGMGVTCGDVGGNVDAGMSVTCGKVTGDVDAGMSINMRRS